MSDLIEYFNRLSNGIFDMGLSPFAGLGETVQVVVVALLIGAAVAAVFHCILDWNRLQRARTDLRANLFEVWLYRHDPMIVLWAQWELVRANVRYVSTLAPALLVGMVLVAPILVQSYHRFGVEPVPEGTETLLIVELGDGGGDVSVAPELVWENGRGAITAMVREPVASRVVWRLRPGEPGIHTLNIVRGTRVEEFPLFAGSSLGQSVAQTRQPSSWRSLIQPRGAALAANSGVERISVDYPEADEDWLWSLTLVSLLAALVTNRAINVSRPQRMLYE